ncbi:MAG: HEAT repeat domain-containing protein [Spirochaetaceae bacterium]
MKRFVAVAVTLVLIASVVGAQQSEEQQEEREPRTIEDLYLSQDIELQIIRSQALSPDREMKILALQSIRSMVEDGSLTDANPGLFVVLESLALEGTGRTVRSEGRIINNYPEIRRQAAGVLGEVGGDEARDVLVSILREDPEPMVLSEAIYALGSGDIDVDERTLTYVVDVLEDSNTSESPDNNLAYATLLTLDKIAEKHGGLSDPEILDAVLNVATGRYIRTVRLKALDTIDKLRGRD